MANVNRPTPKSFLLAPCKLSLFIQGSAGPLVQPYLAAISWHPPSLPAIIRVDPLLGAGIRNRPY
ncbi:hypothetical protein CCACVL1_03361 [Corchorus capsularis]|uniref:Uncharacterized protein n=1 Tax=Corchorus capsularis TaxID=210143 RepID=A0A1R3JZY6_COCAP|nr:hypothetical protein CCACVL1_03361 [Corchorus capsularis]